MGTRAEVNKRRREERAATIRRELDAMRQRQNQELGLDFNGLSRMPAPEGARCLDLPFQGFVLNREVAAHIEHILAKQDEPIQVFIMGYPVYLVYQDENSTVRTDGAIERLKPATKEQEAKEASIRG